MNPFQRLSVAPREQPLVLLHSGGRGKTMLLTEPVAALVLREADLGSAWERIDGFLAQNQKHRCAGYLGYDLRDATEPLPRRCVADLDLPVAHLVAFAREETWSDCDVPPPPACAKATDVRAHVTRRDYEARIAAVIEHVRAGDIFQANLTQAFTATWSGDPRDLFWRACAVSAAPFSAYLELDPRVAVLSASPEEFLSVRDRAVQTRPIKGTRPRGNTGKQDRALLADLLASEKDRAELAMIVDLMRNDLGKVAEIGSVTVGPFPEHATYAQVHHTFARVGARLRRDVSFGQLLAATFPPGSVTGAPKLRAMEIIEDLEPVRRGIYTGALGWFGPGDECHLNVAIRTLTLVAGVARFNAGGGITAASVPRLEYEETIDKARGWLAALGCDRGEIRT